MIDGNDAIQALDAGVSLKHPDRRRRYPAVVPHGHCRACDRIAPVGTMQPTDGGPADLETLLGGRLMCCDEVACRARAAAHHGATLYAVVDTAEEWAGGGVALVSTDPRRVEHYAALVHGVTVRWPIRSDYRRTEP